MSSHLCKLTRVAALRSATPAVSLTPAVGAVSRRFLSTNATAKNTATTVGSTAGPSIVVADGASAPPAEVTPAAETATLHVPVAIRTANHHDTDTTAGRQLRRHVTTTRTILRPLSASPWDILAADQDAQIATQRALLVRSYRGVQRRAVALHRLLRLHESVPLGLPANADEEEGMSLLRADAFSRHVSPLVLGVFTALVDPKALCCLLAPRAEMRFVNAIDAVIEAEHAVLMHDAALSEQHATTATESASRGTRGGTAKRGAAAAAAAATLATAATTPEVAAAQRAQLVAEVAATTARLVHEVVRALYRWQDMLSGAAGEVPTHGAIRREQAARALVDVESEFKELVSARELVARRISMRLTAPGAEVNVTRDEHETEAAFELRSQRRDALVRAKVRHGTRRLIEAHEALQTSLEASKRLAVFHNAVAQTLDPAKIVPSGSPYQFSNTEVASGVAETFRQTQLQVKRAMNAAAPPTPASAVLAAPAAASNGDGVTPSAAATDAASESATRLQVLLARAAQNKRDREARAAGRVAASTDSATPSVYSENGYDFWTLPAVQTKVSSVVEAAPLTLLSKAMRGADVQVAYWPTEVDREDDVAGARAAEQNALKAARAAAANGGAAAPAAAFKSATAAAAPAVAAIDGEEALAPGDVLSAASRVSLLAGVAAGREPLFMRTHVNKFRRLPLPYELLQAVNEHAECDLDELTLRNLRRRALTTAGRAAGAPTRVSKSMKMPPMSTATSSLVDFGPAAVNLGAGSSRRRNAPEELEVRLSTRCDEPLRSAAPHNGAVTQEESDALADWGIVRAPTDAAADVAAVEMLRQQAQASGRPTSSGVRAAGRSSAARRITLQPTSGDGVLTASARALCMNRRQTRAAMDAAAHGESAENCFFRALLPGASSSAVSDAAQMMRFRYRVEMRNHSKTHALLMLSRRWQFVGCSGMREVVGPGFAGSCPLILPGSSHTYESSAFVPLIVPSPQQLQLHEPASPGRRRAAASTVANAHAVSHERLLGVPSTAPAPPPTIGGEEPLSATSASFRQLQDFTANSDGTVFAAAAQHAREFGSTVGWMQGAFQFVAVPADATFSQEGLNLLRKQADRASGSAAAGGASAAPGAGPAAFKKFLRRFYDAGVSNAARDVPPLHVSHVRVVPTALDPFLHQYAVMP